ncbi:MAG TPA: c-type cytochrome [Vicinamibacterales bacterium]|nr:c-type cytochrome [Vicinamibacterales bacterium]
MASATVSAQKIERKPAQPIASVQGVDTFNAYCAVCHGKDAKGNGPAAKALAKVPADLTTIAKRHGSFSQNDVETQILGQLVSHGTREMPIWGPVFSALNGADQSVAKLRLANLVGYLKSIQQ